MAYLNHTYRIVDGERIEGGWRHIFIKNGGKYFLTDLKVYATTDPDIRDKIVRAATAREAREIGRVAPLRPDWNVVRLAVMMRLVREKFRQHPDLAAKLIATGDGRLINSVDSSFSRYWSASKEGRNWLGRILELVRAELLVSADS
jgi:ribA/ribD-fused uncharacterized protein